jgi:integrase-like protein
LDRYEPRRLSQYEGAEELDVNLVDVNLVDGGRSLVKVLALVGEVELCCCRSSGPCPGCRVLSLWHRVCDGGVHDRSPSSDEEITGGMRIDRLARLWLAEKAEEGVLPQTLDRYETSLRTRILPALGRLRLCEAASVSRLDRFLKTIASSHPASARNARTVLGQMLAMAVRHDALDTNPMRELARRRKRRREVRALDVTDLGQMRAAIRAWYAAQANRPGPRHSGDLADIVDLLLATGARLGEVLALRWSDVNLAGRATVTTSGTVAYVKVAGPTGRTGPRAPPAPARWCCPGSRSRCCCAATSRLGRTRMTRCSPPVAAPG